MTPREDVPRMAFTLAEVATALGVPPRTLADWVARGLLAPVVRVPGRTGQRCRTLVPRETLDRFLTRYSTQAREPRAVRGGRGVA